MTSYVWHYLHTYLLHFLSQTYKKWSRIGWNMAKNIFVNVFYCKFISAIIILCTAIWHCKDKNQLAKILILAGLRFECDIQIFFAGRGKFCATPLSDWFCNESLQIVHCNIISITYIMHVNAIEKPPVFSS